MKRTWFAKNGYFYANPVTQRPRRKRRGPESFVERRARGPRALSCSRTPSPAEAVSAVFEHIRDLINIKIICTFFFKTGDEGKK